MAEPDNTSPATHQSYRDLLSDAHKRAWDATSTNLDLSEEIRLLRTLLAIWCKRPQLNAGLINAALTILARIIYIQHRTAGNTSDLEQDLQDAANHVLDLAALDSA